MELPGSAHYATSTVWRQIAGPAAVQFENAASPATNATFPIPGNYLLELSATNSLATTSAPLAVTVLPPPSAFELWVNAQFPPSANPNDKSGLADPDHDQIPNWLEFAIGTRPTIPDGSPTGLHLAGSNLEFTYRRSLAAIGHGVLFIVEWSASPSGPWSSEGVTQAPVPLTENDVSTLWKANLPSGDGTRFVRLRIHTPSP